MNTLNRLSCLIALLFIFHTSNAAAQDTTQIPMDTIAHPDDHPELWVCIEDSTCVYLIPGGGGDTVSAIDVAACLNFYMSYDSLCIVDYRIAEFRKNGERLLLSTWSDGTFVNADNELLNANNCTETFTINTGDSISFYREFGWVEPETRLQDTNNFYALDTLDYSVELVRTSDSTVVALIDSIGVLPRTTPGKPIIYGTRPIMANAYFEVPSSLDNEEVFVRVRLYHRGSGPYWFSREDVIISRMSSRLRDPDWQEFLTKMGAVSPKYAVKELEQKVDAQVHFDVYYLDHSANQIEVVFSPAPTAQSTSVAIYDIAGNRLYMPFMTSEASNEQRVRYKFEQSGTYFIALFYGGQLVTAKKIIIAN